MVTWLQPRAMCMRRTFKVDTDAKLSVAFLSTLDLRVDTPGGYAVPVRGRIA